MRKKRMKTNELTGTTLDWAVAKIEGHHVRVDHPVMPTQPFRIWMASAGDNPLKQGFFAPSTNWSQGGPIIERERLVMGACHVEGPMWFAEYGDEHAKQVGWGPLEAAMRCFVASKLGDEVDVPEELIDVV
jgi:hypothetical protein